MLPGGSDPEAFDMSQDGSTLYVSNEDAGTASIVDVASGKIRSTVKVGREPEGVRVDPTGRRLGHRRDRPQRDDPRYQDRQVVGQIEVGKRPRSIAFTPDGSRAYVHVRGGRHGLGDRRGDAEAAQADHDARRARSRWARRSSPDGKRVYISNGRGGTVSVIDVATDSVLASVPVGQRPWGVAVTPDGRKLYTANGPSNDVSVVDADRLTVLKKIPVGRLPWGVAIGAAP